MTEILGATIFVTLIGLIIWGHSYGLRQRWQSRNLSPQYRPLKFGRNLQRRKGA